MNYIVYILQSLKTEKYYVGQTSSIEVRLRYHNSGRNKSTKHGIPWKIIRQESYSTRSEAFKREQQIKSYKGGRAFKALLQ